MRSVIAPLSYPNLSVFKGKGIKSMTQTNTLQGVMHGKKGLIMGVANDRSIAWGIAAKLAEQGAELAFTFQGGALQKRVTPLAESVGQRSCYGL